jgi:hypothetical protein
MSTARNRFGVSILVALVLAVLLAASSAHAATGTAGAFEVPIVAKGDVGQIGQFGSIGDLAATTSGRTQFAIAAGAAVPLLIVGVMVRRRVYADV